MMEIHSLKFILYSFVFFSSSLKKIQQQQRQYQQENILQHNTSMSKFYNLGFLPDTEA